MGQHVLHDSTRILGSRDCLYLRHGVSTLTVVFVVRSWWRKTPAVLSGLPRLRVPPHSGPVLGWSWAKWKLSRSRWHWGGLTVPGVWTNTETMYYFHKTKLATSEKKKTIHLTWSPISRVKWNSTKPKLISEQKQFCFNCKYTPHYHFKGNRRLKVNKNQQHFSATLDTHTKQKQLRRHSRQVWL